MWVGFTILIGLLALQCEISMYIIIFIQNLQRATLNVNIIVCYVDQHIVHVSVFVNILYVCLRLTFIYTI